LVSIQSRNETVHYSSLVGLLCKTLSKGQLTAVIRCISASIKTCVVESRWNPLSSFIRLDMAAQCLFEITFNFSHPIIFSLKSV